MKILILVLVPFISGIICLFIPSHRIRRILWVLTALAHLFFTALAFGGFYGGGIPGWLAPDALAMLILLITSFLFLSVSAYGQFYVRTEEENSLKDKIKFFSIELSREAGFTGFLLIFLSTMTLVTLSRHIGLLWIGVEATTLSSAPLIYFHRHHKSLEATWKYLMVCSVGIALALLGIYCLSVASPLVDGEKLSLSLDTIYGVKRSFHPVWLKASFILILVGFGTKMGLAPMHTWLPEAHGEAPSLVSALLSGALLNCSFLAILRMFRIMASADLYDYAAGLMLFFGLFSMVIASFFLITKQGYKRMLAYSSIEHMGILAVGVGLGSLSQYGSLFHALNHSLAKAALFLLAGNILIYYNSKKINGVRGLIKKYPLTGVLWLAGFFAITGTPPFGIFMSEFLILKGAVPGKHFLTVIIFLIALVISFIAMSRFFFKMLFSPGPETEQEHTRSTKERFFAIAPPLVLLLLVLFLGLWIPGPLDSLLKEAASLVGRS
ncbi:MAG: hypothetical protein JXJ04_18360 [Spirochaetales bacterium]|nr:hypothetical protein [Spirochaetales bacterium]